MELAVQEKEVYRRSLGRLLPRGSFWDSQLSDPQSDVSLLLSARSEELHQMRTRMADLQKESLPLTAIETFSDWERVLLRKSNETLPLEQRRQLMFALQSGNVNTTVLKQMASLFGVKITDVFFPYRPACFGHCHFGIDRIATFAALSVVFVQAEKTESSKQSDFESAITNLLLANHLVFFFYNSTQGGTT